MFMLLESIRSAFESIWAHGFRSLLTSLGIIIGVTSVIAVVSIVQGLSYTINAQFAGLGGNSLTIRSYTPFKKQLQGRLAKLRDSDMQVISQRIDGISDITPVLFTQTGAQGSISYRSQVSFSRVIGIGPSYLDVNSVYPQQGRFFTADDDERRRLVCAVGVDVIEDLEIPDDPIGQFFRVGNEWCKIVGVIEKRGELLGFSQDNFVLLPYGTAKRIMGASRDLDIQIQLLVDDISRQAHDLRLFSLAPRYVEIRFQRYGRNHPLAVERQVIDNLQAGSLHANIGKTVENGNRRWRAG